MNINNYNELHLENLCGMCILSFPVTSKSTLSSVIFKQVMNMFWPVKVYVSNSIHQLYVSYNVLLCYKQVVNTFGL